MVVDADIRAFVAANDLTERSSVRATGHTGAVLVLYGTLSVAGFAVHRWPVWVLLWLAQACVLVGSYSAMHEAAHATLYPSRGANRVAGVLWASSILMNWSLWRSFHLEHHAHTGSDRDPKLKHRLTIRHPAQYAALPIGGLAFLAEFWGQSIGALAGRPPAFVPGSRHRAVRRDGIALIAASTAMVVGLVVAPHLVLVVWVMPLVLTYCVVLPATGMSEHYGCDADGSAFDTTRTVVSNRLFRFLVWNNNFHGVHHLLPAVPFHHAPAVHAYIEPRMRHLSPSYLRFHGEILGATRIRRSTSQLPHVP